MASTKPGILQLVNGDGEFQTQALENFVREHKVSSAGVDYQVIAITGPQSSGKSTLMNTVFGTTFEEMDALTGRHQTTKGIWLARSDKIAEPLTIVLDLEGSDGRERGEDDNSFERQSSLFALAIADVLLVNMWAKDVGREAGAGKPLLKTIFQVNLKLFQPAPKKRRTVLLFVFRDRTKTPLSRLKETWEEDLASMWASITKPQQYESLSISDFFEVQYAALPNFEEKEEDFRADANVLRRRFSSDDEADDKLVRVSEDKLPGSSFALSLEKVWEVIRDQKDLNLPAHKVMVANIRCAEIMADQLRHMTSDQAWTGLASRAASQLVPGFGRQAAALRSSCLAGYDEEARYFEAGVREAKREDLVEALDKVVGEAYAKQLELLREHILKEARKKIAEGSEALTFADHARRVKKEALEEFGEKQQDVLIEGTPFTAKAAESKLAADIDSAVAVQKEKKELRSSRGEHPEAGRLRRKREGLAQVVEIGDLARDSIAEAVTGPAISLLDTCPQDLWPRLSKLQLTALDRAAQGVSEGLQGYEIGEKERSALDSQLKQYARDRVEVRVREASNTVLSRMRDRFNEKFSKDENGLPRAWGPTVKIPPVAQAARQAAAQLLSQLAILRLDQSTAEAGEVETAILSLAAEARGGAADADSGAAEGKPDFDIVAASQWPHVPKDHVLLSPAQCRTAWHQFASDSNIVVQQALTTQEAHKAANNRAPPIWVWLALFVLGFNEMMTVIYNPLWLIFGFILVLFGKTVYQELDVDAELQRGLLPGAIALSAKLVPTVKSVIERTRDTILHYMANPDEAAAKLQAVSDMLRPPPSPQPMPAGDALSEQQDSASGVSTSADIGSSSGQVRQRRAAAPGHVELSSLSDSSSSTLQSPAFA